MKCKELTLQLQRNNEPVTLMPYVQFGFHLTFYVTDETLQTGSLSMNLEGITPEDMEIFNVPYHTAKQLRHFKFALVFALNHLVSGQHLVAQVSIHSALH